MANKLIVGINDLQSKYPKIAEMWDYNKNEFKPNEVHAGSNKYAWFICKKGHSFLQRIGHMPRLGENSCPYCSGNRILVGFNDLATTNPELLDEWDFEKNVIKPTEVSKGSQKIVWWKCSKGHSFQNKISTRTLLKTGCIYCAHQKTIIGENDLATTRPDLLKEWNYDKNSKTPQDVFANTNYKVWWICEKGHEYEMSPSQKSRGCGCPYCANKKILKGFNDLATTHPKLLDEWDYEKNTDITPDNITYGSDRKVWWKCKKGHEWKATINSRVAGNKCPKCAYETQSSLPEKTFYYYLSKFFDDIETNVHLKCLKKRELDIYIPSLKLAVEYDGASWHKDASRDSDKDELCLENGITLIRIREEGCVTYNSKVHIINTDYHNSNINYLVQPLFDLFKLINNLFNLDLEPNIDLQRDNMEIMEKLISYNKEKSFASVYPEYVKYWNHEKNKGITPDMVSYSTNKKVWWKCSKGHEFMMIPGAFTRKKATDTECCPYCSNKRIIVGENDLFTLEPWIKDYWDFDKNPVGFENQISIGSPRNVWVKCKNGHSFSVSLVNYLKKKGDYCPYCWGRYPIFGETDLATTHPNLVKEWNYEKNGDFTPQMTTKGSDKKVWWKCSKGHEWQATISSRSNTNCGCPYCSHQKTIVGETDLASTNPELIKEWNYEKNANIDLKMVMRGSKKRVWWKCSNGHEWQATISSRACNHTSCPICHQEKIKKKKS